MKRSIPKSQTRFLKRENTFANRNLLQDHLQAVVKVLTTPIRERNTQEVQLLASYMKAVSFFSDLETTMGTEALQQCCQYMSLEQYGEGEVVST
jgi:hypothetical protein